MNKRQRKKMENKKALFTIRNLPTGSHKIYLKKKFWNKGFKNEGMILHEPTGDFISMGMLNKFGCDFLVQVLDSHGYYDLEILKSWDNKNHMVSTD